MIAMVHNGQAAGRKTGIAHAADAHAAKGGVPTRPALPSFEMAKFRDLCQKRLT